MPEFPDDEQIDGSLVDLCRVENDPELAGARRDVDRVESMHLLVPPDHKDQVQLPGNECPYGGRVAGRKSIAPGFSRGTAGGVDPEPA